MAEVGEELKALFAMYKKGVLLADELIDICRYVMETRLDDRVHDALNMIWSS